MSSVRWCATVCAWVFRRDLQILLEFPRSIRQETRKNDGIFTKRPLPFSAESKMVKKESPSHAAEGPRRDDPCGRNRAGLMNCNVGNGHRPFRGTARRFRNRYGEIGPLRIRRNIWANGRFLCGPVNARSLHWCQASPPGRRAMQRFLTQKSPPAQAGGLWGI